jgi:hypothetical protein
MSIARGSVMGLQSIASIVILGLVIARAVNILAWSVDHPERTMPACGGLLTMPGMEQGQGENRGGEHDPRSGPDEDLPTRFTRGVVDGFTEASQAFSNELEGTNRFPDLMGRSVAGMIRANARLLDEVATVVRQASDGFVARSRTVADEDFDYERLADMVAERLRASGSMPGAAESTDPARSRRKT